jgi:integrase
MSLRQPKYRCHKARNCAVVTIAGRDHYLGALDSPASWEAYHRLVAEHIASQARPEPAPVDPDTPLLVTELIARYWRFAKSYYVKNDRPTSEQGAIKQALGFVRRLYGSTPAHEFGPKKLAAVREAMIAHKIVRRFKVRNPETGVVSWAEKILNHGLARQTINQLICRVKRTFAWGVEEELFPAEVHAALQRLRGLRKNKSAAREKGRVRPVPSEHVDAVLPHLPPIVRAMVEVHRLCGGRPQDIVSIRADAIDRSQPVWEFRPPEYKTEHHNLNDDPDLDRVVFLGPKAQQILAPFLLAEPSGYLFSAVRSERTRNALRRLARTSPMTPSQQARRPRGRQQAPFRDHYDVASYRRAIRRACEITGTPIWAPNQLRHSRLTEIRREYGLEASRVVGGHREVGVTQLYAEQDHTLAHRVMAKVG